MVPNWPIFKALSALRGAKIAPHGLKMGFVVAAPGLFLELPKPSASPEGPLGSADMHLGSISLHGAWPGVGRLPWQEGSVQKGRLDAQGGPRGGWGFWGGGGGGG